jgi:hypothetical protein
VAISKFICHSYHVTLVAVGLGWLPGANYTNLRNIKKFDRLGFLDIDWKNYDYLRHLQATKDTCPMITVARDVTDISKLHCILDEANELSLWADKVIIVPKDPRLKPLLPEIIPDDFILGYSVPTSYGGTRLPLTCFGSRRVHLLGGHPAKQRVIANGVMAISLDCNRLTLDAAFGDYFDGETFRPHPIGGYELCISDSLSMINQLWDNYDSSSNSEVCEVLANTPFITQRGVVSYAKR